MLIKLCKAGILAPMMCSPQGNSAFVRVFRASSGSAYVVSCLTIDGITNPGEIIVKEDDYGTEMFSETNGLEFCGNLVSNLALANLFGLSGVLRKRPVCL